MTELQQAARRARRRLWLNRWLGTLGWSVAAAGVLFAVAVVIQRLWVAADEAGRFFGLLSLVLAGSALTASIVWSTLGRDSLAGAAARLDLAAGLRERLSTGLYCEQMQDPFAQAVVADATRASHGIAVRRHLPVQAPRSANYAGASVVLALLVLWLLPTVDLAGKQEDRRQEEEREQLVERARAAVEPVIKQQVEQLRREYPDLEKELADLKLLDAAQLEKPSDVRTEPIKRINEVGEKLESRRQQMKLGQVDEFKKLARRLSSPQKLDSPVGRLAQALKGDLKAARDALGEIKNELAQAPKTEEDKERAEALRQQLGQMSDKLDQIAQEDKKCRQALSDSGLTREQIEQALKNLENGDLSAIEKTLAEKGLSAEQIDKLMQRLGQCKAASCAAKKLAQNLKKACQGKPSSGEMSESAAAGFSAAGEQLSELEGLEQELNQIDSAMADLASMKQQLAQGCSACRGTGMKDGQCCSACNGTGLGQKPGHDGQGRPGPGMGALGQGEGGVARKEATDVATVKDQAKVHTLPGKIISTQFVQGEPVTGEVSQAAVDAALAARRQVTEAIASGELPRIYHGGVKKYFDHSLSRLVGDEGGSASPGADPR